MKCPRCGCKEVVHLVYGWSHLDKKTLKDLDNNKAKHINEPFTGHEPSGYCPRCGENVCFSAYYLDVVSIRFYTCSLPGPAPDVLLLERKPGRVQMSLLLPFGKNYQRELTSDEWCYVLHKLYGEFFLAEWKRRYVDPDILDGREWKLVITRENGEVQEYYGCNDYPPYWKELTGLFEWYFEEEFQLRMLNKSRRTRNDFCRNSPLIQSNRNMCLSKLYPHIPRW